ncbi:hypothetical protein BD408DRAFT_419624, partial [Parasitella parasitica]
MINHPTNSKKRKSSSFKSSASDANITTKKKVKKPRVSVKEELNVEIPSDVSVFSTINSETSSSLVLSNDQCLPPISSLLLYKPSIVANRFDPFYQSIEPLVQYAIPGPTFKAYDTLAIVKHETSANAAAPSVMPIIPYYFHHVQFGIEACMHQLEYHRQQQIVKAYSFNPVNDGVNY